MLACYCIFNLVFSVVAVLGNLLVIHALWKSSSIPATVKKLFLSLALSDLAVGMLPQLGYYYRSDVIEDIEWGQ